MPRGMRQLTGRRVPAAARCRSDVARFVLHFTPPWASRRNAVERLIATLAQRRLKGEEFRSGQELKTAIHRCLGEYQRNIRNPSAEPRAPNISIAAVKRGMGIKC